jgi:hypothetical protein
MNEIRDEYSTAVPDDDDLPPRTPRANRALLRYVGLPSGSGQHDDFLLRAEEGFLGSDFP